jgi:ubiquinone biosynthesis protein UbiJ
MTRQFGAGEPGMRTAPTLACAALEIALNRYLQLEPSAMAGCARLAGKSLAFEILDLGWCFTLEPLADGRLRVSGGHEPAPDVRARASSLRWLGLALSATEGPPSSSSGLQIEGDGELLQDFRRLLAQVGFDAEEWLAAWLPEGAAHRAAGALRGLLDFGRRAAQRLGQDTAEYLVEETGDLARTADVEEWMDAVDALREDCDRLEARLERLEARAGPRQGAR